MAAVAVLGPEFAKAATREACELSMNLFVRHHKSIARKGLHVHLRIVDENTLSAARRAGATKGALGIFNLVGTSSTEKDAIVVVTIDTRLHGPVLEMERFRQTDGINSAQIHQVMFFGSTGLDAVFEVKFDAHLVFHGIGKVAEGSKGEKERDWKQLHLDDVFGIS